MILFYFSNWFECILEFNLVYRVDFEFGIYVYINMKYEVCINLEVLFGLECSRVFYSIVNKFIVLIDNLDFIWSYKYFVFFIFNNKIDIMILKFKRRFEFFYKLYFVISDRLSKDKYYDDKSLGNNFDFFFKLVNVISDNLIKYCYNLRL